MTVLRELVAKLGLEFDPKGFDRADAAVNKLRAGLREADTRLAGARGQFAGAGRAAATASAGLGAVAAKGAGVGAVLRNLAATVGLSAFLKEVVTLASDANETRNVLDQTFGKEGAQDIADWSERVAKEVGRSKYTLRDFAGQIGAMAAPMTGNKALAAEMSTSFAQLAVDLSSFFNTTETDALAALKSGLAGEVEPLRRFGVVLQDATLQEFARTLGIHKKVQAMTVAQKAELRYRFIMAKTTDAQGDAARTGDEYANATRALKDGLKDLATDMGAAVIPVIRTVVRFARDGVEKFRDWANGTSILKSAMIVLGGVAAVLAYQMMRPFLGPALAIGALILLLDDLHALFTGGTSVIGHYLDKLFGIGTADAFVQNVTAGIETMVSWWGKASATISEFLALTPDLAGMWELVTGVGEDFGVRVALAVQKVMDWVLQLNDKLYELFRQLMSFVGIKLPKHETAPTAARTQGKGVNARVATDIETQDEMRKRERFEAIRKRMEASKSLEKEQVAVGKGVDAAALKFGHARRSALLGAPPPPGKPALPGAPPAAGAAALGAALPQLSAAPKAIAAPAPTTQIAKQTTVNVAGSTVNITGANLADVRRVVTETLAAERRKTAAALTADR